MGNHLVAKHLCIDIDILLQQKHKQMHLINRYYSAITVKECTHKNNSLDILNDNKSHDLLNSKHI